MACENSFRFRNNSVRRLSRRQSVPSDRARILPGLAPDHLRGGVGCVLPARGGALEQHRLRRLEPQAGERDTGSPRQGLHLQSALRPRIDRVEHDGLSRRKGAFRLLGLESAERAFGDDRLVVRWLYGGEEPARVVGLDDVAEPVLRVEWEKAADAKA